jgi:threonine synthase
VTPTTSVVCAGCGVVAAPDDPFPFRCPNAGRDDVDHVMTAVPEDSGVDWPAGPESNPFIRYRTLAYSYSVAARLGLTDDDYVGLVSRLDQAVSDVDGHGFAVTPFEPADALAAAVGLDAGGLWIKDETGNVSGSHKARHLFGLLILLEVAERAEAARGSATNLVIASCGNAALAAGVVAAAGGRPLEVFVPTWADPVVVDALRALGARIQVVARTEGAQGDPTFAAMQGAIRGRGALPFTCQGTENGLAIEGGHTLGYEMASVLSDRDVHLDRLVVQVGGGALASACVQAFRHAKALGALSSLPRIHAVQTQGGYPLVRAYERLAGRILVGLGEDPVLAGTADGAEKIQASFETPEVQETIRYATSHRSEFMWPWEEEPTSIATGILDDVTYDWLAVVRGMLETAGFPIVVSEEVLEEANAMAHAHTRIDVDHTGSSGLAGLFALNRGGQVDAGEHVAVLFTGRRRDRNSDQKKEDE